VVADGELYLTPNKDVKNIWLQDIPTYITNANQSWISIPPLTDTALGTL